jgi:hypothetical protein
MSDMKLYKPRGHPVYAEQVTRNNIQAIAAELGGEIANEGKASDPTDEATWLLLPTLDGVKRLLVTTTGPIVGRESGTNRVVAWENGAQFDALYEAVGVRGGVR